MAAKKTMRFIAISSFVLSIVLFFALSVQFDNDPVLFAMLEKKDMISTFHRLAVYYIPGACMIGGMFALVFTTKKILIFMSLCQLLICFLLSGYIGKSVFMLSLLVIYTAISIIYLVCAIFYKSETKKSR